MVESVDTPDLKSCDQQWSCGFNSRSEYIDNQLKACNLLNYKPLFLFCYNITETFCFSVFIVDSEVALQYCFCFSYMQANKNYAERQAWDEWGQIPKNYPTINLFSNK